MTRPLLQVRDLRKYFAIRRGPLRRRVGEIKAVDGVSFDIMPGETLGLLGEQGSGKSTIARLLMCLLTPTSGEMVFAGQDLTALRSGEIRRLRREIQLIFPDPYAALNPRLTAGQIVEEPLEIHRIGNSLERAERTGALLQMVGLNPFLAGRFPHELSGGGRQRVSIARSLATDPFFVIADEPVAAYEPPVQGQLLDLLTELKVQLNLTYLLLSRNPATVRAVSDHVGIMYLGRLVEWSTRDVLFDRPLHPHTQALLAADPLRNQATVRRRGNADRPAYPVNLPPGCHFYPRCPFATDICREEAPAVRDLGSPMVPHLVACHHAETLGNMA